MYTIADFRSDTVTKPTITMRDSMFSTEVGDDVFGDDQPTIDLENYVASLAGKQAGLFVPSGTMGNLISCMVHCNSRDSEMIVGNESHIHLYEQGGSASIGGIHSRVLKNNSDGTIELKEIESAIRGDDVHYPRSKLICLETTQNRCGGRVLSLDYINSVGELAKKHNVKLHVDGARIMNAVTALNISLATYVAAADSISICLSKGLAAPIGSVVCGTKEFIANARRLRKALGGGMRQTGILAAPALLAIKNLAPLVEDHRRAKELANRLNFPGITIGEVETNIVYVTFNSTNAKQVCELLATKNIKAIATAPNKIRFVTHYMIEDEHISRVIDTMKTLTHLFI